MAVKLTIYYTDDTFKEYIFTTREEAVNFAHNEGDHVRTWWMNFE